MSNDAHYLGGSRMELIALIQQLMGWVNSLHNETPLPVKIAGFVLLLISFWKTSIARKFYWDKLGAYKSLVAPVLGLIASILVVEPLNLASVLAGLAGGVLASGAHEVLDAVKALPVIGPKYASLIDFIKSLLKAPEKPKA